MSLKAKLYFVILNFKLLKKNLLFIYLKLFPFPGHILALLKNVIKMHFYKRNKKSFSNIHFTTLRAIQNM